MDLIILLEMYLNHLKNIHFVKYALGVLIRVLSMKAETRALVKNIFGARAFQKGMKE